MHKNKMQKLPGKLNIAKEEKCANSLSNPFTKENIQIAKVNHEKEACFVLLVIKERQIQITLIY